MRSGSRRGGRRSSLETICGGREIESGSGSGCHHSRSPSLRVGEWYLAEGRVGLREGAECMRREGDVLGFALNLRCC
jgi:hypothetical protein